MEIDVKKVRNTTTDSHGRTQEGLFSHDVINLVFGAGKGELSPESVRKLLELKHENSLQGQIELIEEDVTAMLGDTDRNARTERGTSAWWAQNVLAAKNNLRRCMESKPPKLNDIAFAALALGKTWTAAWVSTTHESDALRGKQTVQSASEGGKESAKSRRSRKGARDQDLQRHADEVWARNPNLSVAAVSRLLAREPGSGVGFETIRRVIRKESR